ncbi:MAG: hypothetical protein QOF62_1520 [Pyrinomonadaceae bacterium]|nr:hypothetical protein [Pyrinomonadaceae bacterium]
MCRRINTLKGDLDLTPLVLRGDGFDNPNAVLSDLNKLIREHKTHFERGPRLLLQDQGPVIILLLSLTEFTLPQISSLITLPDWFPRLGGNSIFILIEDLTRTADGPMNIQEVQLPDLCERIFALEVALVNRLSLVLERDRHAGQAFYLLIKNQKENEKYGAFLSESAKYHREVSNPKGFRPSLKEGRCLISRLLYLVRTSTVDEITKRAEALSIALGLPDGIPTPPDSIVSVLLRATNKQVHTISFARNLLMTVYASAQLITAAAHSDEYPRYPIVLLRSVSFNLRNVLDTSLQVIENLEALNDGSETGKSNAS